MKSQFAQILLFTFVISSLHLISAQCPFAQDSLAVNQVSAGLLNAGDMFWNLTEASYEVPKGSGVHAIFAGALWFGAVDDQGTLRIAAQTYRQQGSDFQAGPIGSGASSQEEICTLYDRFWKIKSSDVASFRSNFADGNVSSLDDVPQSLLDWPGRNSSHAEIPVGDMTAAPFIDKDGDGNYDPLAGDYPDVRGDEAVWWIYNDQKVHTETGGEPLNIQVGVTAYAFSQEPLDYTTFYKYDVLNAGPDDLQGMYVGQWLDVDLGCYENDFVGCVPEENLGFVYNGTLESETCPGGYAESLPLLGFKLIEGIPDEEGEEINMTSFMTYASSFDQTGNPEDVDHYYNYLQGFWKDGTPITFGQNGYGGSTPTNFMFPSNPSMSGSEDEGVWSECASGNEPEDRRFLASMGPVDLASGESKSFTVAMIWDDANMAICPDITAFSQLANNIKAEHEQLINTTAAGIAEVNLLGEFRFQPNPMQSRIEFRWHPESPVPDVIEILGVNGNLLMRKNVPEGNEFVLERGALQSGMYFFQFSNSNQKLTTGKFLVN